MKLELTQIEVDPTVQIRQGTSEDTIRGYEDSFDKLPPVDVFKTPDGFLLADGFHRIAAAKRLGLEQVDVTIHEGTRNDALEFAVIANTKNGDRLTSAERDAGIRRLKQIHPGWPNRQIADAMSVAERTVTRLAGIDKVKRTTFPLSDVPAARPDSLTDTHYREIAKAEEDDWQPLLEATQRRGWTSDGVAKAVRNLKDDRLPTHHKRDLVRGLADPVDEGADGSFAVSRDTISKKFREVNDNDAELALLRAFEHLANARLFRPEATVAEMQQPRLDRCVHDLPGYIAFLQDVLAAARQVRKPRAVL